MLRCLPLVALALSTTACDPSNDVDAAAPVQIAFVATTTSTTRPSTSTTAAAATTLAPTPTEIVVQDPVDLEEVAVPDSTPEPQVMGPVVTPPLDRPAAPARPATPARPVTPSRPVTPARPMTTATTRPPTTARPATTARPVTTATTRPPTTARPATTATTRPPAPPTTPSTASTGSAPTPSGPLVIRNEANRIIENVHISNPGGICLDIENSSNVIVRNSIIGPCGQLAVRIYGSTDVRLESVFVRDTARGVLALESSAVRISHSQFLDAGRNFVFFDKVTGAGNYIGHNWGENRLGASAAEDLVNLYKSHGTAASPIQVVGNHFRNGGPSPSGSGIMSADAGGSHQVIRDNVLVNPGQVGIGVASGTSIVVEGNRIYSDPVAWANVGLYVWNQYNEPCGSVTVRHNQVRWTKPDGTPSGWWNGGNCGTVTGLDTNNWTADLTAGIYRP